MPAMNADVRLLHFSDPHLFASPQGTLRGVQTLAALQRVLTHAAGRHMPFDALLCTGDVVNDEPGGYAHFARVLSTYDRPVYCVPGNHDDAAKMRTALARAPFQVGGHADLGNWRMILLDSSVPHEAGGRISEHELAALDAALRGTDRHVMVCMHHHPVNMASRWLDEVGIDNADALFKVLDAHSHVRLISWGHVHQCFDGRRRGVRLLATPSTCSQFLPMSADFAVDGRPPAYRRLTLCADGSIETDVVWVEALANGLGHMAGAG